MFWFRSTVHINNTEPTGGFCPRSLLQYPLSSLPNLCITGAPIYFFLLPAQGDFTSKKKNRSFSHVRSRSPPFSLARSCFMKKNKRSHRWRSAGVSLKRTCPVGMWMPLPLCKTLARERGGEGSQIILKGRKPVNDPNTLQMIISQACKDFISWCRWSFCRKCHIITSVDVYSGPVHLKVGHSFLPLRVLKGNIIMQGIKRWADLRVWLSRIHKHLILQWWDRSRDCGHKQILWKFARALYYFALMCECALTEFSHSSVRCPLESRTLNAGQGSCCHCFICICSQDGNMTLARLLLRWT